ncbi:YqcI/YcgG family protein [Pullulanibacillus sp. KACC 23026]|uniref:YqcI/YcgG family protein n=1 Tax=Pullulanibacillus sp. KACC 23026 TaxID=3028315 RepID=UPI0023AFA09D|nr:YqcI/YcgG family protein [Pullulanibacillus sp. KACC 23026]WEG13219.1 YqcI/YcgG family protein [Pullulanibacillus sp. KACC 23026]
MRLFTMESLLQSNLESWKKDAARKFSEKMRDRHHPFPCIPATIGYQLDQFRYGFLPEPWDPETVSELANALEAYSKQYRDLGSYTSLILFYKDHQLESKMVEDYEQIFWEHLTQVSHLDKFDWPKTIPTDPANTLWEFCFHNEQYFVYCGTPAHKNRQSRQFPYLMLAITPRSVLVDFYSSQNRAAKIKSNIRKRLTNYDTAPIHPNLNTYGREDNYEWKQYFLRDDETTLSKCPFHRL